MEYTNERKYYPIFDYVKFILCFMIVLIHTGLYREYLFPWLRLAVPLFFMISSFLLFSKLSTARDEFEEKIMLKNFVMKNLKLYFFWFIVLFPITLYKRIDLFNDGIMLGILRFIRNIFFDSSFIASWFLMALIIGSLIVYFISKKTNNKIMLGIGLFYFLICVYLSSYKQILPIKPLENIYLTYEKIFCNPIFNFRSSLLWITLGKIIFEKKPKLNIVYFIIEAISLFLLYIEWRFIKNSTTLFQNDYYFMLLPSVLILFIIIINIHIPESKFMRNFRSYSIIIYVVHGSVISMLNKYLYGHISNYDFNCTLLTILISIIISFIIINLSKIKHLKFLKNAY